MSHRNRLDYTHASVTAVSRDSNTPTFTSLWDIFILFLIFVFVLFCFVCLSHSQGRQELLITPKFYGLAWIRCLQISSEAGRWILQLRWRREEEVVGQITL